MKTEYVLIAPLVTEKASTMAQKNIYTFEVNSQANKDQIAEALQKIYKVKVSTIRILNRKGKVRRVGRRMQPTKTSDRKIAYIVVSEGTIDLFPKA